MPRLRIVEDIPVGSTDPLPVLFEFLEGHTFSRISKATYLRVPEDNDEIELWYEDTLLVRFQKDGMIVNFGGWPSPSAVARLNAVLSIFLMYCEHRKGGNEEGGVYICEAGGGGAVRYRPDLKIPYAAPEREVIEGEEQEEEAVALYG